MLVAGVLALAATNRRNMMSAKLSRPDAMASAIAGIGLFEFYL